MMECSCLFNLPKNFWLWEIIKGKFFSSWHWNTTIKSYALYYKSNQWWPLQFFWLWEIIKGKTMVECSGLYNYSNNFWLWEIIVNKTLWQYYTTIENYMLYYKHNQCEKGFLTTACDLQKCNILVITWAQVICLEYILLVPML